MNKNEHLVFIGDLDKYISEIKGARKKSYERMIAEAERLMGTELPEVHPPCSITYMGVAITNLALTFRLTGNEKYLLEAQRWMKTIIAYKDWGNITLVNLDLSAAWCLWGLSLGYDWLKDYLDEDFKAVCRADIARHAELVYQYKLSNAPNEWPSRYFQNHNWIDMSGVAVAGYVLAKEDESFKKYSDLALENFKSVYDCMTEDGSNYEGGAYWRYGAMWLFVYAHLAKVEEGVDFFKTCEHLQNTFFYRLYQSTGSFAHFHNYGDCHDVNCGHSTAIYFKTAAEYGNGYAQTMASLVLDKYFENESKGGVKPGIKPEAVFEFIFFDPTVEEKPFSELPLSKYFPDLGLLCVRDSWEEDAKTYSVKCSAPGGAKQWKFGTDYHKQTGELILGLSHHHSDNLSYFLNKGADFFTKEDGYNRNIMPENHSCLLVDGQYTDVHNVFDVYILSMQKRAEELGVTIGDMHDLYTAEVKYCKTIGDLILYKGETAKIYPTDKEMKEVSRTVVTDGLKFIAYVDVFKSESEHIFQTLVNTENKATKLDSGLFCYELGTDKVYYDVISDVELNVEQYVQKTHGNVSSQEPDNIIYSEINTLQSSNAVPAKSHVMVEAFSFEDSSYTYENVGGVATFAGDKKYEIVTKSAFAGRGIASECDAVLVVDGTVIEL